MTHLQEAAQQLLSAGWPTTKESAMHIKDHIDAAVARDAIQENLRRADGFAYRIQLICRMKSLTPEQRMNSIREYIDKLEEL